MSQYLGDISAYALAVSQGYTGTEEEYAELMASYATVGQTAVTAAQTATTKASEAATSATTATTKATEATTAATTATTKAGEASTSASTATSAKDTAVSAASTATTKATEATTAAATATSAATTATTAKDDAVSAKTAAQTAQTGAETAAASVSASAAQIATNAEDISQLLSEFTALESDGVVPSAEQILTDKGITDSVPYHYRKTGGDGADRLYDQIVGGTVCFNQLVKNGNFSDGTNYFTINSTTYGTLEVVAGALRYTLSADAAANDSTYIASTPGPMHVLPANHVMLCSYKVKPSRNTYARFVYSGVADGIKTKAITADVWNDYTNVIKSTVEFGQSFVFYINATVALQENDTVEIKKPQVYDLTAMFGSTIADYIYQLEQTTAGAGVAFFKALFPNDYYPYNAGELVSVSGLSEHKMVGFNQWDEEWEVGSINSNNGTNYPSANNIRSKNYIPVVCDSTYYIKAPNGVYIFGYDNNKNYVGRVPNSNAQLNTIFDVPVGVAYIRFYARDDYGATYNHDICINLSDPTKNGTYEPYKAHSYLLDSTLTLRGMFKLDANNNLYADGDVYSADGTVTRKYGIVDLGTLDWVSENSDVSGLARADARNLGLVYYSTPVCSKFNGVMPKSYVDIGESEICFSNSESLPLIRVKWSELSGKTNAEIIAALTGVMFVYELATPTTEEADPYQHLQQCDPNGTEEYVSTGIVPVGHNSFYPENLRAKVEQLPWNFANLIAPTESAFVATRNYVTGDLFIVSNVLYKATSNIANGGTITPNTNCTATTLAEIISALA